MNWTDLLIAPRAITGVYGTAPSLASFALEEIVLESRAVKLIGDLGTLPDPLPPRWTERGYTRAKLQLHMLEVEASEITGTPTWHFDAEYCIKGDPMDITVTATGELPDRQIVLEGIGPMLRFRLVDRYLSADLRGYEPGPY